MNPLRIKVVLQALGASKTELAEETGLSVCYLSRLLNGKVQRPTRKTKQRLVLGLRRLISERNVV
ncbi:MAG TPA: hypothetical protein DIC52_14680 [Candidatus Latescibacteria bacterium]|nr:hypothetical protein [Candidatus Latescibacterota bacterium]